VGTLYPALSSAAVQVLLFLVWGGGIVVSLVYWSRYPRVARLTLVAFVLLVAAGALSLALTLAMPWLLARMQAQFVLLAMVSTATSAITTAASAASWVLLLIAAFKGRDQSPPAP
jgi:hypothetical protein